MSEYKDRSNIPILIVDDFLTIRKNLKASLQQMGFENITEAEDGSAAWSELQSKKFELIISDWNMPNLMGIDLLKKIRAEENLKEIPFVMITAEAREENSEEALTAGATNYFSKPFNIKKLKQKIDLLFK